MSLFAWLFPSTLPEKEKIVDLIENENARLNGAVQELSREVKKVKQHRAEVTRLFDDTLRAINKEYRKND